MNESFLEDIRSQPDALGEALGELRRQVRASRRDRRPERVVLTGSGDSLIASIAARDVLARATGVPTEARSSLDAARFIQWSPRDLAIVSSISGEASRSIEAAQAAAAAGAEVVALTCDGGSSLAGVADVLLLLPSPLDRSIPHARDYTATLLGLAVFAETLGGQRQEWLDAYATSVAATLTATFDVIGSISVATGCTWFLGAGPDVATARYGAMKHWEAAGIRASWDDLEEFAHGSLLMAGPGDRVVAIGPSVATDRIEDMLPGFRRLGVEVITVGDVRPSGSEVHLVTPTLDDPAQHPFVACLPLQVLTYHEAVQRDLDVSVLLDGSDHGPAYDEVHRAWVRQPSRGTRVGGAVRSGA